MSGRTTHGYNACVHCDRNLLSYTILSKICYIGHHHFLAKDKPRPTKYRRHVFNAKHENCDAPKRLTTDELQVELEKVRHISKSILFKIGNKKQYVFPVPVGDTCSIYNTNVFRSIRYYEFNANICK